VVLWALGRGVADPPFLVAAMASMARLTHPDPVSRATAISFALALQEVALAGGLPTDLKSRLAADRSLVERWGGGPPSAALDAVLEAALQHPTDPAAARAALGAGPRADLAGAMVGLAVGAPAQNAPPPLLEALDGLVALRGRTGA
jgi:hypothetical protein